MLSQEPVVGSAQGVVVARARAIRDAAVQHCLERLSSQHLDFELEGSARSVVQFEGVLPEAAPCIAYAPVDLDEQAGIVIDVPPEVLVRLFVHLARCLNTEHGGGLRHPLRAYRVPPYTYRCSYFCQFLFSFVYLWHRISCADQSHLLQQRCHLSSHLSPGPRLSRSSRVSLLSYAALWLLLMQLVQRRITQFLVSTGLHPRLKGWGSPTE